MLAHQCVEALRQLAKLLLFIAECRVYLREIVNILFVVVIQGLRYSGKCAYHLVNTVSHMRSLRLLNANAFDILLVASFKCSIHLLEHFNQVLLEAWGDKILKLFCKYLV